MEQPTVRVVYGLTLETGKQLREEIERELREAGIEIISICRYRKDGIYQYVAEQKETVLILEEGLQASSLYGQEDIIKLTDSGNHKILFLLDQKHYGTDYMKTLYLCGVLNAVFLQEATGAELVRLMLNGRTNEEARSYYGIKFHRDAQKEMAEINTEYLGTCLEYIEDSTLQSEMDSRYRFTASRLSREENKVLIDSLSPGITRFLEGNEIYRQYRSGRTRRGFLSRFKGPGKEAQESVVIYEEAGCKDGNHMGEDIKPEAHRDINDRLEPEGEEDMLSILDRYRNFREGGGGEEVHELARDSLIEFGHYLQTLEA